MAGGERKVNIRFTGDAGVLKGSAGELRTLFQNLVNDVDDNRLAGDKWADAFKQQSDRIRQEMNDIRDTADVLADSLGPEMVQALEAQGRSVEQQVQELKKMGLSYDDIKMSSSEIATSLRDRDDALRQSTGTVGDGFKRVSQEAGQARNVMANFAGNAIQELPGVAGAFGPLNMALSQATEYAADGSLKLADMGKFAGPIAGVAVGMWALSKGTAQAAKAQENLNKFIKDSLRLSDEQFLQGFVDQMVNLLVAGKDLNAWLKDFASSNIEGLRRLRDLAKQHGDSAQLVDMLTTAIQNEDEATRRASSNQEKYATVTDGLSGKLSEVTSKLGGTAGALDTVSSKADDAAESTRSLKDAYAGLFDEFDNADALDNVADSFDSIKSSAEDAWSATTEGADDAAAKQRNYERTIRDTKRSVVEYADELGNVPESVVSEVLTLIDEGKFDEAKLKVASWANEPTYKNVTVVTNFKGSNIPLGGGKAFASGTESAPPGVALVGEQGPELVFFRGGEKVLNASRTNSILSTRPGGSVNYITINAAGADAREVVRLLAEEVRRNGGTLG